MWRAGEPSRINCVQHLLRVLFAGFILVLGYRCGYTIVTLIMLEAGAVVPYCPYVIDSQTVA